MKVKNLYGEFADQEFRIQATEFCDSAAARLRKNLTKEIDTNGLTPRSDEIYNAINWWIKRREEFNLVKKD